MPQINLPMPFIAHNSTFTLLLWRMTEDESQLLSLYPDLRSLASEYGSYKSSSRRLEYLSVRALLYEYFGGVVSIWHSPEGKPLLEGGKHISISHTKGYCTVILSDTYNVAIDIEYRSDRVLRVADRFLRADEKLPSIDGELIAWCAKETLYKLHSSDCLGFADMRINASGDSKAGEERNTGKLQIENIKRDTFVEVNYLTTKDYILTYAVEENI